ncbi:IMP cyclohydrolase [Schaalia sp. JY-X169]|uniref:IMP cyclohydrolase n=1 Tax=Schaalia sp. JY-X169 TaxID=2758572 RepID=UPI0015F70261|nr:IMP cyclohydrolase [Schaalia sp. JY-X169]
MSVYEVANPETLLSANPYPGRGIVLGQTPDGTRMVVAYFIMGRSPNSRNRVFERTEDGIRTRAYDPSKVEDPSLIIYNPLRTVDGTLIVTNGDQTDTVRDALVAGRSFEDALETREFEPDAPNLTPRISGLLLPDGRYQLSILKSADAEGSACSRFYFNYPPLAGVGHFLHTYNSDGDPLPSFTGEPRRVAIADDVEAFTQMMWEALDPDNRVALYVRSVSLTGGPECDYLINQNGEETAQ